MSSYKLDLVVARTVHAIRSRSFALVHYGNTGHLDRRHVAATLDLLGRHRVQALLHALAEHKDAFPGAPAETARLAGADGLHASPAYAAKHISLYAGNRWPDYETGSR